jgi:hypothetical protein
VGKGTARVVAREDRVASQGILVVEDETRIARGAQGVLSG